MVEKKFLWFPQRKRSKFLVVFGVVGTLFVMYLSSLPDAARIFAQEEAERRRLENVQLEEEIHHMKASHAKQRIQFAKAATENAQLREEIREMKASTVSNETTATVALTPPDLSWGPDPFGWNKGVEYQYKKRKNTNRSAGGSQKAFLHGKPTAGPKQELFNAHREARHAIIGPAIKKMAATNKNTIILLLVNSGQMPLFMNFVCSCEKRQLAWKDFVFVFALDEKAEAALTELHVASYHLDGVNLEKAAVRFGHKTFSDVVFWKSAYLLNTLCQDVDIVWKTSPVEYFEHPLRKEIDIAFMKDGNAWPQQPVYANSGFHFNRCNARTLRLWEEVFLTAHEENTQQQVVQPLLIHHYFVNSLRIYILPPQFANGNFWGATGDTKRVPSDWIVLHASWTANTADKIKKLKNVGEWYVPPNQLICDYGM